MALTLVLPPSLGAAKATARAELLEYALLRTLDEPVTVIVAASYADLAERAASGAAQLVWAPAAVCAGLLTARAVFTIVRAGRATYRSALIGRRDQAPRLDALAGLRAAWVDPLSAGGYLLAAFMLRERGIDPERTFASQSFTGSHRAAVEAVLHGAADVTAVSVASSAYDVVAEMLRWYAGPAGDRLAPITFSRPCPNDAILITTALDAVAAARIAEKLVPLTDNARARSRLLSALEADGLVRADLAAYHALREALLQPATEARRSALPPGPRSVPAPPPGPRSVPAPPPGPRSVSSPPPGPRSAPPPGPRSVPAPPPGPCSVPPTPSASPPSVPPRRSPSGPPAPPSRLHDPRKPPRSR